MVDYGQYKYIYKHIDGLYNLPREMTALFLMNQAN